MLELMQAYFDAIGVKMSMSVMDYGAFQKEDIRKGGAMLEGIWRPDLSSFVYALIHPKSAIMPSGKSRYAKPFETDPEFKKAVALMEEQRRTMDVNKRREVLYELQRVWAQNIWKLNYPDPDSAIINSGKVRGYSPIPGWSAGSWKYVWLAE